MSLRKAIQTLSEAVSTAAMHSYAVKLTTVLGRTLRSQLTPHLSDDDEEGQTTEREIWLEPVDDREPVDLDVVDKVIARTPPPRGVSVGTYTDEHQQSFVRISLK